MTATGATLTTIFPEFLCGNNISWHLDILELCELYMVIWKITGCIYKCKLRINWLGPFLPLLIFITVTMMPQSSSKNETEQVL